MQLGTPGVAFLRPWPVRFEVEMPITAAPYPRRASSLLKIAVFLSVESGSLLNSYIYGVENLNKNLVATYEIDGNKALSPPLNDAPKPLCIMVLAGDPDHPGYSLVSFGVLVALDSDLNPPKYWIANVLFHQREEMEPEHKLASIP
ncbi:hypothetical protein ACLOJK_014387 [Asimina triloba]